MRRCVVIVALVVAFAVGCGGHQAKSPRAGPHTRANPVVTGPGRLVDIGGGRRLYLDCEGSGNPTIVLEAGFGGNSSNWSAVQTPLSATTRTCAYDRAGLGSSMSRPGVHDAADEIDDLARLLSHAHVAPPYVLVGHSYGGLLVRLFAHAHPDETAGVVLVDAVGRNQDRRLLPIWRALPLRFRRRLPKPTTQAVDQGVNVLAGEALDAKVTTLGDAPLAVVTRGRPDTSTRPLPASARRSAERLWMTMQDELAAMSGDHVHAVALHSSHFIQRDQPGVVIRAVRAVVRAARTGSRLPSCPRLFRGAAVGCRSSTHKGGQV